VLWKTRLLRQRIMVLLNPVLEKARAVELWEGRAQEKR
jgi:hypothetical protein